MFIYELKSSGNKNVWHTNIDGSNGLVGIANSKTLNHMKSSQITRTGQKVTLFKYGGRVMFASAILTDGIDIYYAENRVRETTIKIAGWVGGLAGGIVGATIGTSTTEMVYDWIFTPLEKEEWEICCEL